MHFKKNVTYNNMHDPFYIVFQKDQGARKQPGIVGGGNVKIFDPLTQVPKFLYFIIGSESAIIF